MSKTLLQNEDRRSDLGPRTLRNLTVFERLMVQETFHRSTLDIFIQIRAPKLQFFDFSCYICVWKSGFVDINKMYDTEQ